jgi:hypothetical protein
MAIQKIPNTLIADNAVTAAKIANGTLTADDIAANSITAAKLSASTSPTFGGLTVAGNATGSTIASTGGTTNNRGMLLSHQNNTNQSYVGRSENGAADTGNRITFDYDNDKMQLDSDGDIILTPGSSNNVGIGETNPDASLHITSNTPIISFDESDASQEFRIGSFGGSFAIYDSTDSAYRFVVDGSGNVLVGKTATDNTTAGTRIHPAGYASFTIANDYPIIANRLSSDGDIAVFRKDGSTVGAIGVVSGNNLKIHSTSSGHSGLSFGTGIVYATDNSGDATNGGTDLGSSSYTWKDIYLGGGAYLGGTAAADKLDDYEEGTYSPTLANAYNISSLTLSEAGRYVKVGNLVHFEFQVSGSFTNAAVESRFSFTLPFNSATTSSRATGMFSHHLTTFSNGRFNNGQIFSGTTVDTAQWVYISTNQLSGTGSFTGRGTVTYVSA